MSQIQLSGRTAYEVISTNLSDLIAMPDKEAAPALNQRMAALDFIRGVYERSYPERMIIIREFERRRLWQELVDPDTGTPFSSLTAWMSCSNFLGCRRVNFEAKRDMETLKAVPSDKLIEVPKSNIKVLVQLSTQVHTDPSILAAARALPQNELLEKVEREQPNQHVEMRRPLRFAPGRKDARIVEEVIRYALEHDIAGTRDEALVRAFETAMETWKLDEELKSMPQAEMVEA